MTQGWFFLARLGERDATSCLNRISIPDGGSSTIEDTSANVTYTSAIFPWEEQGASAGTALML
jgi:hypothetical protein